MNEKINSNTAGFIALALLIFGFFSGWFLHPDTKVINSDASMTKEEFQDYCEIFWNGTLSNVNGFTYCEKTAVNLPTKVISVLAEKKECEEKGGKLDVLAEFRDIQTGWQRGTATKLICTKPSETIFSYELTN